MQAVQFFREHPELCDLVILDMVMPNMGARECIEALKRLDPKVRVVLSTGYGRNEAAQKLLDCGLIGFIQKPYHLERLAETVAIALSDDTSGVEFSEKRVA
jgi:DNA-binding NtrC family response regulator